MISEKKRQAVEYTFNDLRTAVFRISEAMDDDDEDALDEAIDMAKVALEEME